MPYMCMGCNEIYDMDLPICPKAGCEGDVVWIDELMVPIVKILREKGYITSSCCSGHIYSNIGNAQIAFQDFVFDELTEIDIEIIRKTLPKSWELWIYNKQISFNHMIYACYDKEYEIDKWKDIVKANIELLDFVQTLPVIKEYCEDDEVTIQN